MQQSVLCVFQGFLLSSLDLVAATKEVEVQSQLEVC